MERKKALPIRRYFNFLKVLPHLVEHHYYSKEEGNMKRVAQHAIHEQERIAEQIRHRA